MFAEIKQTQLYHKTCSSLDISLVKTLDLQKYEKKLSEFASFINYIIISFKKSQLFAQSLTHQMLKVAN